VSSRYGLGMISSGSFMRFCVAGVEPDVKGKPTAGAIDISRANEALQLFDEVRAMTWRLLHPTA